MNVVWIVIGIALLGGGYFYPQYGAEYPQPIRQGYAAVLTPLGGASNFVEQQVSQRIQIANDTRTDLRTLIPSYINTTEAQEYCLGRGGTWAWMHNQVGCIGAGTTECDNQLIQTGIGLCTNTGANWTCDEQNVYCKY